MAFFKSAFDGESKLQILNGNYRIPDSPQYSPGLINLIKDMLSAEPGKRPDVGRVSFPTTGIFLFVETFCAQPIECPGLGFQLTSPEDCFLRGHARWYASGAMFSFYVLSSQGCEIVAYQRVEHNRNVREHDDYLRDYRS